MNKKFRSDNSYTNNFLLIVMGLLVIGGYSLSAKADSAFTNRIFVSYESNGADYFSSIGIGTSFVDHSNLGYQVNTSIGNAEVLATDGYVEEFVSWEGNIKFGYFSHLSIYVEVGVDLSEWLFADLRYDEEDWHDQYGDHSSDYNSEHGHDDIDAYVGMGIGLRVNQLQVDGVIRVREIDSEYWEAESEVFSGLQLSLNF